MEHKGVQVFLVRTPGCFTKIIQNLVDCNSAALKTLILNNKSHECYKVSIGFIIHAGRDVLMRFGWQNSILLVAFEISSIAPGNGNIVE
jgi:hypothetical protein